jgi:hypothetical protein
MVACVFFRMEDAIPRLDELRAWAGKQAKNFVLVGRGVIVAATWSFALGAIKPATRLISF